MNHRGEGVRIGERIAAYERGRRDAREHAWGRGRPRGSPTLEADYALGHHDEAKRMKARNEYPQLALSLERAAG